MSSPELIQPLQDAGFTVQENVLLAELGSFQIGGPARWLLICQSPAALLKVRQICVRHQIPVILIGEGSNILFSDQGWPGLCVRYVSEDLSPQVGPTGKGIFSAALPLTSVVAWAVNQGWAGIEAFTGIPGTVGGAVVGNAGAWGVQMEHVLSAVHGINAQGETQTLEVSECDFSYRDSKLKHQDFWVTQVEIQLKLGEVATLQAEYQRITALRAQKHPHWQSEPCIGSFFKNLEPSSAAERRQAAGFFLEQVGAKQIAVGGAGVYQKHANILVKQRSDCQANEVAELARNLQAKVKHQFDIDLIREVRYLGDIAGESASKGFY